MLDEFQRLNRAFCANGIQVLTLKGFSLIPDFCEDPATRHQTDFDFLAGPNDVQKVAEILSSFGYSTPRLSLSEESCFTTPLNHVPTYKDDLYALQHHRKVDLHVSLSETSPWIAVELPRDSLKHAVPLNLCGVTFQGLPIADRFLAQVFHAFRHAFRSWLRLSWLFEIGRFMELHRDNQALWARIVERTDNSHLAKRIFAFILSLARRLFQSRMPLSVQSWMSEGMTPSLAAWLDYFSVDWAVSDWPGSLSNLFLASEFIEDGKDRMQYFASRLFPKRAQVSIGTMANLEKKRSVAWNLQRWR